MTSSNTPTAPEDTPMTGEPGTAQPRRRRQLRWSLLALVVIMAILASAAIPTIVSADPMAPARWQTFVVGDPTAFVAPPPPAAGSARQQADLAELRNLQVNRTQAQIDAIARWSNAPARWNEILLTYVRKLKLNPVRTSRALGLLNAAIYDAVVVSCVAKGRARHPSPHDLDPAIVPIGTTEPVSTYPSTDALIAGAAVQVLEYVFQGYGRDFAAAAAESRNARLWAGTNTRSDLEAGDTLGRAVGARVVERGRGDGADAIWSGTIPTGPGFWKAAGTNPLPIPDEPLAGTWKPWLLKDGAEFRPGPPPWFGSPEWQKEADEVVAVGKNLTDAQLQVARFWADGAGTDTPPGHWIRLAIEMLRRDKVSGPQSARVLAYTSVAEADAFISCWDAKYEYWSGRPTALIPGFGSSIITPNFPAYTSGHSSVSGAASTVLGYFFPGDNARLRAMAQEAAVSRLYGGIHFRADNEVGLTVGTRVGGRAVSRARADGVIR